VDRVGGVLRQVVARQPAMARLSEIRLRQAAALVLGEALATRCESIEVRGALLSITTADPALARLLRQEARGLLRRLNEESRLPGAVRRLQVLPSSVGRQGPGPPPSGGRQGGGQA
jgi:hypothetical protein